MKIILTTSISLLLFTATFAQKAPDYDALVKDCLASVNSGAFSKAIEFCSDALAVKKDSGIPYYLRAVAYSELLHDAETKSPTGEPIKLTYELRRQFAVADAEKCVQFIPNEYPCYSLIGSVLYETNEKDKLEKAVKNLGEGIRLGDKNNDLYKFRAVANFRIAQILKPADATAQKFAEQAIADYTTYIPSKPAYDSFVYRERADVYEFLGKYDLAIADLSKFIELKYDDDVDQIIHRGKLYLNVKKYQLAIDDFSNALELAADDDDDYKNLILPLRAVAYKSLGKKVDWCADMKASDAKFNCDKEWKK